MKKIFNISLSILLVFSLSSCEKDSNVEVPLVNPKLVTACFLSPTDDGNYLKLSWSAPIFNTTNHEMPFEENADVYISDETTKVKMQYMAGTQQYYVSKTQLPIIVGKKYTLSVISSKSKNLYAETIIPEKPVFSIAFQSVDSVLNPEYYPPSYDYRYFIKLNISNAENTAYYRISVYGLSGSSNIEKLHPAGGENRIIHGDYSGTIILNYSNYYGNNTIIEKLFVNIHKVDETYYRYHNALENYTSSDIFSEPTLVYSNVENGLGVFCSYNNVMDSVVVK